jgi:histone H3/H4
MRPPNKTPSKATKKPAQGKKSFPTTPTRAGSSKISKPKPVQKTIQKTAQKSKAATNVERSPAKLKGAAKRKQHVLKQIRNLQQSKTHPIPRAPFCRLVRELMVGTQNRRESLRVSAEALEVLLESTEAYMTAFFNDAFSITLNRNQVTLKDKDMKLVLMLRGPGEFSNY